MKQRLYNYIAATEKLIESDADKEQLEAAIKNHLVQTEAFQHERLIHLIVTVMVTLLFGISMLMGEPNPNIGIIVFRILLLCLDAPYFIHYFFLENGVQKLYVLYDRLAEKYDALK